MNLKISLPKIIFIGLFLTGMYLLITNLFKQMSWEKTIGVVLDVKEKEKSSGQFYPLVVFKNKNSVNVKVEVKQSSNRFFYKKGEKIPILYPLDNYQLAEINSKGWVYGFPFIFILVGLIGYCIPYELFHIS